MTTTATSSASLARAEPVFSDQEKLALAGFLAVTFRDSGTASASFMTDGRSAPSRSAAACLPLSCDRAGWRGPADPAFIRGV
jgi:hypothetical protein